jgi:hypothetical protein
MRKKFDIGDLIEVSFFPSRNRINSPVQSGTRGIVLETRMINNQLIDDDRDRWHTDEYKCRVEFIGGDLPPKWVRAKWLKHISMIEE